MYTKRTGEKKRQIIHEVDTLIKSGMIQEDAAKKVGIHFSTYYAWKKKLNGHGEKPKMLTLTDGPMTDLKFDVISLEDAKSCIGQMRTGRFLAVSYPLVQHLKTLRKKEAISFPAPENKKERVGLMTACTNQIRKAGLSYVVRHSQIKKSIVVFYKEPKEEGNGNG